MLGSSLADSAPAAHGSALPLLPPPFCVAKGRAGEGLAFVAFQAPLASRLTPLLRGWWIAGEASAEHGSALPLLLPPFCVAKGRAGEGLAFVAFQRCWLRGLRRFYRAGGWLGKPLPSMARHYRFCPLPCAAGGGEGWGGGGFCGLSGAAGFAAYAAPTGLVDGLESPCRAWLGTTASGPSLLRSKGEGWGGVGFCGLSGATGFAAYAASTGLVDGLESPCRAWLGTTASAPSLLRSKGEGWGGVGFCGLSGAAVFAAYAAPTGLVDGLESPCRAWLGTTASAPSLAPQAEGRVGEGLAFVAFQRCWLRGLRRSYEAGGLLGKPLPSMARHYLSSLLLPRRLRALVGGSVLLRGHR